jgi:O-antigen ligase
MWIAHFLLSRSGGITAWLGTVIVVDNVVCSTVQSHLFDFNNGWLYVLGVGVLGGTVLQESATTPAKPALSRETVHPGSNPSVLKRLSCPPVDWKG